MWAFVDGGRRNLPGERPSEVKLFDPEGAVTIYDTPPPEETPPSYPAPTTDPPSTCGPGRHREPVAEA